MKHSVAAVPPSHLPALLAVHAETGLRQTSPLDGSPFPRKKNHTRTVEREYLVPPVCLECPLALLCTPGRGLGLGRELELPTKFNSHLGFYFVN